MVMESKCGQMELGMRVSGNTIKHVAKENFGTLTETYLKENGKMTRRMATESMYI